VQKENVDPLDQRHALAPSLVAATPATAFKTRFGVLEFPHHCSASPRNTSFASGLLAILARRSHGLLKAVLSAGRYLSHLEDKRYKCNPRKGPGIPQIRPYQPRELQGGLHSRGH